MRIEDNTKKENIIIGEETETGGLIYQFEIVFSSDYFYKEREYGGKIGIHSTSRLLSYRSWNKLTKDNFEELKFDRINQDNYKDIEYRIFNFSSVYYMEEYLDEYKPFFNKLVNSGLKDKDAIFELYQESKINK